MKGRELTHPLLSEETSKNTTIQIKPISSKHIFDLLRIKELKSGLLEYLKPEDIKKLQASSKIFYGPVVFLESKAKKYSNKTYEKMFECIINYNCGFLNSDPEIDYSWGFTCGAYNAMKHPKYAAIYQSAGVYAMTPICVGVFYDVLCCPILALSKMGGYIIGASFEAYYHMNRFINDSERKERTNLIPLSQTNQTFLSIASDVKSEMILATAPETEAKASSSPKRQVMK